MPSLFEPAMAVVSRHEWNNKSNFTSNPNDPGGATKYGISLRYAQGINLDVDGDGDVDEQDIRLLTLETATEVYRDEFLQYNYQLFDNQQVANKTFDMRVHMGPKQAHVVLQRALNRLGAGLKVDGVLGAKTINAANTVNGKMFCELQIQQAETYRKIVAANPKLRDFLQGFLNRAYDECR